MHTVSIPSYIERCLEKETINQIREEIEEILQINGERIYILRFTDDCNNITDTNITYSRNSEFNDEKRI